MQVIALTVDTHKAFRYPHHTFYTPDWRKARPFQNTNGVENCLASKINRKPDALARCSGYDASADALVGLMQLTLFSDMLM